MNVKFLQWYGVADCEYDRIRGGRAILETYGETLGAEFQVLIHRSNLVTVPVDKRMNAHSHNNRRSYPEEWHTQWKAWTRGMILIPHGYGMLRFTIGIYLPTKELRICSKMRRINEGPFALRLIDQEQVVFLLAEKQINVRAGTIRGGTDESDKPLPTTIDLY